MPTKSAIMRPVSRMFIFLLVPLVAFGAKPLATAELHTYRSPNIKVYAFEQVLDRWGDKEWVYFSDLISRESGWKSEAENPNSTAYGLGQFLNSTWETVNCEKTSDKYEQIDCTIDYVELRYKTPKKAIVHHNLKNWY